MSRPPRSATVRSTSCWGKAGWVTSPAISACLPERMPNVSASGAGSRSLIMTDAPAAASWRAMARPIPRPAPVTRATFDSRLNIALLQFGNDLIAVVHSNVGGQHDLRAFRKAAGHFDVQRVARARCDDGPPDGTVRLVDVHALPLLFLADSGFRNRQRNLDNLRQDKGIDIRAGKKLMPFVLDGAEDFADLPRALRNDLG